MSKIKLHGGPWNGKSIKDSGTVKIRMGIATEWKGNRPAIGARVGNAVYEPTPDRKAAHWLHNEWEGTVLEIIEAGDSIPAEVILRHWLKGGTGITNFPPEQLALYEQAIIKSGRIDLSIVKKPIGDSTLNYYSLHRVQGMTNLSDFWSTFTKLKAAQKGDNDE